MSEEGRTKDYDSEPVKYCARCFSLKVKYEETIDSECCGDCGCSDILEAPVEEWEKKYVRKYGHQFAKKEDNPEKTFIFKMPIGKLKILVFDREDWREIIGELYPNFPGGYGKADSVILFFDTLIRQNRINELRLLLYKRIKF